jgi:hypothetical protein
MKYATEIDSGGMIYLPSFTKTSTGVHIILKF